MAFDLTDILEVNSAKTLDWSHSVVLVDSTAGPFPFNLPPLDRNQGFFIKNISTNDNEVTIGRNGATIDGKAEDFILTKLQGIRIVSTDTGWWVTMNYDPKNVSPFTADGTTTDSDQKVITIKHEHTVAGMVRNTGASNGLICKFTCIHVPAGEEMPVTPLGESQSEFIVPPGSAKHLPLSIPHYELYVNVRSELAGQATTFHAEFSGT